MQRLYEEKKVWLLGDSGYPLEPWLMVPYDSTNTSAAALTFNDAFCSARSIVERCIGTLLYSSNSTFETDNCLHGIQRSKSPHSTLKFITTSQQFHPHNYFVLE